MQSDSCAVHAARKEDASVASERAKQIEELAERLVEREVLAVQSATVEALLKGEILSLEDAVNLWDGEDEYAEVLEWWLVTPWLAEKLGEAGEVVLEGLELSYWGRCTSGQSMLLDGTFQRVAKTLLRDEHEEENEGDSNEPESSMTTGQLVAKLGASPGSRSR